MRKLIALFLVVIMVLSIVSCAKIENDIDTDNDEKESVTETEKETETETETEEPNPLAKIVKISLESDTRRCLFYLGDHNGSQTVGLTGVKKVLFNINNRNEYSEVNDKYAMRIDDEEKVLTHVIVVFQKGHKLTENDKNVLKKFDMDYMFEK